MGGGGGGEPMDHLETEGLEQLSRDLVPVTAQSEHDGEHLLVQLVHRFLEKRNNKTNECSHILRIA